MSEQRYADGAAQDKKQPEELHEAPQCPQATTKSRGDKRHGPKKPHPHRSVERRGHASCKPKQTTHRTKSPRSQAKFAKIKWQIRMAYAARVRN
jgi:hypothetical protein